MSSRAGIRMYFFKALTDFCASDPHLVVRLKIQPELRVLSEILSEFQRKLSGHGPGSIYDMADAHRRDVNVMSEAGLRDAELVNDFLENDAGVNRLEVAGHKFPPYSVVISYFNIMGAVGIEPETYAPLVVDSNAPLTCSLARKSFEAIRGRKPQVIDPYRRIELGKPHERPLLNIMGQLGRTSALKKLLGFLGRERSNHGITINKLFINVKRELHHKLERRRT